MLRSKRHGRSKRRRSFLETNRPPSLIPPMLRFAMQRYAMPCYACVLHYNFLLIGQSMLVSLVMYLCHPVRRYAMPHHVFLSESMVCHAVLPYATLLFRTCKRNAQWNLFPALSFAYFFVISLLIRSLSDRRTLLSGNCPIMSGALMVLKFCDLFHHVRLLFSNRVLMLSKKL